MRPLHRIAFLAGALLVGILTLLPLQVMEVTAETNWADVTAENLKLAQAADEAGRIDAASAHYKDAFEASVKANQTPLERSRILRNHGVMLWYEDRNDEARELHLRALAILRSDSGLAIETAETLGFLAARAVEQGDAEEGESLIDEAVAIYSRELGRSASATIAQRVDMAGAYFRADEPVRGNQWLEAVERDCEEDRGAGEDLAECLSQIADSVGLWLEGEEAAAWYRKALGVRERSTQPDSPERIDALLEAGSKLDASDLDAEAIKLYRRALAALARRPDAEREADARESLAKVLAYDGKSLDSIEQYEMAMELRDSSGAAAVTRITSLQNAAVVMLDVHENVQAFKWLERSVAIARAEYGDPSERLNQALDYMGQRYQSERWNAEASRTWAQCLEQLDGLGQSESRKAAGIHERLGDIASVEEDPESAVVHYERMVQIYGSEWGEDSPRLIFPLGKLSAAYTGAERQVDAEAVGRRILRISTLSLARGAVLGAEKFRLPGIPGWMVLLSGFVGVGAVVVAGGVALTRRLARVDADASVAAPSFQIVGYRPSNPHQGSFQGQGGELFGIWIVNMLLTVLTAGIYHFWAKVRLRRYVWSHSGLGDDRFAFHGTPKELFLGWLKGAPLLAFILYGPTIAQLFGVSTFAAQMIALTAFGVAMVLWPIAEVGAHRYRLTRSSWRGIRFAFDGSPWRYLGIYLLNWPLWLFTLGLWTPFFNAYKRRFLIGHMSFGSSAFQCEAQGRDLFWRYVLNWILFIPTLGMYGFWYRAYRERYYWSRTTFRGARFRCTVTGSQLLEIYGVGTLLILMTLGLAWPWVHARRLDVWLQSIHIDGNLDLESVRQRAQDDAAVGEGFADFLGLDRGFLS